jgi:hypothetical protein
LDLPFFSLLKTGNLNEILLSGKKGETRLKKDREGNWNVLIEDASFPAEKGKIDRFFEILDRGRIIRTATEKKELWDTFEVGEEGLPRISFTGDRGTVVLINGKPGDAGTEQYVRFQGENRVLLLSEGLSFYAEQGSPYWSELRLFPRSLEGKDLVAISVKGAVPGYRLVREKKETGPALWLLEGRRDVKIAQSKADGLANALAALTASDFVPPSMKGLTGIGKGELIIEFLASDGKSYSLEIGNSGDETDRYCSGTIDGRPLPHFYKLTAPVYGRVVKTLADLTE